MSQENLISPLAGVNPGAKLGSGVVVEPFAVIDDNVEIGDGTIIRSGAVIRSGARIGSGCEIHPHAVIACTPQDLKFKGEDTILTIGDRTVIRECATVSRGTASKGQTIVGSDCLVMAYAHIAHDCVFHDHIILGNACQVAGEVEVFDWAIMSGGTLVHQFVRVGAHCMVQGGSRITKDVPPYTLIGRDPAAYCGINIVGLRRRKFTNDQIFTINDIFRKVYNSGLNISDAIRVVEEENEPSEERDLILNFIRTSNRGIVRGAID